MKTKTITTITGIILASFIYVLFALPAMATGAKVVPAKATKPAPPTCGGQPLSTGDFTEKCCYGNKISQKSVCLQVPIGGIYEIKNYAEYIKAIYSFSIAAVGVMAVVMIMIGGFIYIAAAGDAGKIGVGKTYIVSAIVGLIIVFTSYLILNTVNPRLTKIKLPNPKAITGQEDPYAKKDTNCFQITEEPVKQITEEPVKQTRFNDLTDPACYTPPKERNLQDELNNTGGTINY